MANYTITQKLNKGGQILSSSFQMVSTDADLPAFLALLEGGYEVKKVDEALSNMAAANIPVMSTNPVVSIGLVGINSQYASIKPFKGAIHFKQSANVDEIATVLRATNPFVLMPAEKPIRVNVKRYEVVA